MAARLSQPIFGLDYAQQAGPGLHRVAGSKFAVRYLSRSLGKVVTRAEAQALKNAGIELVLVFEDSAARALQGAGAGQADRDWSINQSRDVLGFVPHVIYYALDVDPTNVSAESLPYFDAVKGGGNGPIGGPYGGFDLMAFLHPRGFPFLWQTYAWSSNRLYAPAQLYQYSNSHTIAGIDTDFDHAFYADYGQVWNVPQAGPNYNWFDQKLRHLHGERISERGVMMRLDRVQREINADLKVGRHPSPHLTDMRDHTKLQASWLFQRLENVVHTAPDGSRIPRGDPRAARNWKLYRRGWRGRQLRNAALGHRQP